MADEYRDDSDLLETENSLDSLEDDEDVLDTPELTGDEDEEN